MAISTEGLADMERSPEATKHANSPLVGKPSKYSYGTSINLDKDELKKLGIKEMPKVGDEYRVVAVAEVKSISQSDGEDGENSNMSLQITHMKVYHEDEIAKSNKEEKEEGNKEPKETKQHQEDEMNMGTERHIENFR